MSDVPELDAAGLPEELSAFDQILHRGEANPRTRSGIMTVELLDDHPGLGQLPGAVRATRRAKSCGCGRRSSCQRCPPWRRAGSIDPDFNLDFHVRRVRVPEPGTMRQVFDLAEVARSHRWTSPGRCGPRPSSRASKVAGPRRWCISATP